MIMDKPTTNIDTVARTCIAVRLRLLNRVVTNLYDDALRPLGLKVSQMNVLVLTAKLGLARPAQVCDLPALDVARQRAVGEPEPGVRTCLVHDGNDPAGVEPPAADGPAHHRHDLA